MRIMSKSSEILLRNALTMFVDDEYVNISPDKDEPANGGDPSAASASKFSRSKSFKESFKITFKRSSSVTRSLTRSKSSDCASEGKFRAQQVIEKRDMNTFCFDCVSNR